MFVPKYFSLHELLPKAFYEQYYPHRGQSLWELFDPALLRGADAVRREFGKMVANTWYWGGVHQYRGYRPFDCGVGSTFSQHKFGRAIDLIPVEGDVDKIRGMILQGFYDEQEIRNFTGVELAVGWLHLDTRNRRADKFGIKTFEAI